MCFFAGETRLSFLRKSRQRSKRSCAVIRRTVQTLRHNRHANHQVQSTAFTRSRIHCYRFGNYILTESAAVLGFHERKGIGRGHF